MNTHSSKVQATNYSSKVDSSPIILSKLMALKGMDPGIKLMVQWAAVSTMALCLFDDMFWSLNRRSFQLAQLVAGKSHMSSSNGKKPHKMSVLGKPTILKYCLRNHYFSVFGLRAARGTLWHVNQMYMRNKPYREYYSRENTTNCQGTHIQMNKNSPSLFISSTTSSSRE